MTAPDDAVERAARKYAPDMPDGAPTPRMTSNEYQRFRRLAFEAGWRAALDAAGVGETTVEWGVWHPSDPPSDAVVCGHDEPEARRAARHCGGLTVVSRRVTEWKPVEP